jgi:hypothetical protein
MERERDTDRALAIIFGERAMGRMPGEKIVEWAVSELVRGNDSPHLRVLAGLSKPFHWSEVDALFRKALEELGIEEPGYEAALWEYARQAARDVLDDRITAPGACQLLSSLRDDLGSAKELLEWVQLDQVWEDLCELDGPHPYLGATKENFTDLVKAEARALLQWSGEA